MCGIAGALYLSGRQPDARVLEAMARQIAHRGPDGEGVAVFTNAGLAHRRLSILDLTDAAAQPLASADGRVSLVFNGEIYNFRELRRELETKGERFSSTGDTEVILRLYLDRGVRAIERLDGMFALAIWDDRERRLVLACDRTGKKPLYVYEDTEKILFGSEIKAILAHPDVDRAMSPAAVPQFLSHGYVPNPGTFYRRIRKLPPASFEVLELGKRSRGPEQYWDFPLEPSSPRGNALTVVEAEQRIREVFTCAVERRLVSDVPLGAFLSGGIDSTLVVGVMARLRSTKVKTFSIGFEGYPAWDETGYARLVARRFETEHTEFKVRPESFDLVEKLAWHYDEPFGDSSAIPTFIVSSLTREHVKVALTGDGGDEVFGGYPRFIAAAAGELVPAPARRLLDALARMAPVPEKFHGHSARARRFALQLAKDLPERLRGWLTVFTLEELRELLSPEFAEHATVQTIGAANLSYADKAAAADPVNRVLYVNARTYLLDDLNTKVDRASMAASLETRAPFLDTALMELSLLLPGHMKIRGTTTKWILKRAFRDLLPKEIVHRKKMGFGVPLGAWFRGALRGYLEERLLAPDAHLYPILRRAPVERLFRAHHAGDKDNGLQMWALWMLELWLRRESAA
ncbi:MAG TPA: asparagine synthase (glutamine-hydrolyzing) [Polyangiaceae bacterium]|nr:asparagine synthase (glutamine-hydrolyzing) [Polyangiaceae bacterium]